MLLLYDLIARGCVDVEQRLLWSRLPGVSLPTKVSYCFVQAASLIAVADCGELDIANDKEAMVEAIKHQLMKKCTDLSKIERWCKRKLVDAISSSRSTCIARGVVEAVYGVAAGGLVCVG